MRIAITTWYGGVNPGTLFQLYGLYSYLSDLGHDVWVVQYKPSPSDFLPKGFRFYCQQLISLVRKKIVANKEKKLLKIYSTPYFDKLERRKKLFDEFYSKIKFTPVVSTDEEFANLNHSFDIFIAGSDQIWNTSLLNRRYLLDYVSSDKIKAAFGPSVGTGYILPRQKEYLKCYLSSFNYIAVRERKLANILNNELHIHAEHLLDPSMLIQKDKYLKRYCSDVAIPKEKYLFCYFCPSTPEQEAEIHSFAQNNGLIVVVAAMFSYQYRVENAIITVPGPEEWLGLIANASVVMTSSYHCTIFSLMFHRDLYVFESRRSGKSDDMSLRYREELETYGISHRLIRAGEHITLNHQKPIDYDRVQLMFEERLKNSRMFFKQFC